MTLYKTQTERVKFKLKRDGFITRNEALKVYITRLSAIIQDLEAEGYVLSAAWTPDHKDYKYELIREPAPKQTQLSV